MKTVRFIFGATICLLAAYGGYELYVQKFADNSLSDDIVQELRDAGFDVGPGESPNDLSAMFQSDLGTPSSSFSMIPTDSPPLQGFPSPGLPVSHSGVPNQTSGHNGLPPSLRNSVGESVTVVAPEQQSPYSPDMAQFYAPVPPPSPAPELTSPSETVNPPLGSPETFQQSFDIPLFLNSGNSSNDVTATQFFDPPGEATSTGRANSVPTVPDMESNSENVSQFVIPSPPISEQPVVPEQALAPAGISAYTFGVMPSPAEEIRTMETTPAEQHVYLPPIVPGEQHPVNPCAEDMAVFQPFIVTTHPQVQPLPPVENDLASTPVNSPVIIPHLSVTSLPPVEDEVPLMDNTWATMPAMPNPPSVPLPDPPQIETPVAGQPPQYVQNDPAVSQPLVTIPAQHPIPDEMLNRQDNNLSQLPPVPSVVQPEFPAVQQAVLPQEPEQQQPIRQVNGVTPLPQAQDTWVDPEVATKVANIGVLLTQNQVAEAYDQLSRMYFFDEMTTEERQYVARHLDLLAGGVLFSKRHHVLEPAYLVREGDTVESIATQYKITPELLGKLNSIPSGSNVEVGTELKVLRGPLDARIYPDYHEMVVTMRGKYACRFPISVGSSYAGQEGGFTVQEKAVNRGYQLAPGMEVIPPGDPANPLGSRWIELSKERGTIGIHGTNNPTQIGTTRKSAGFFGLREQDITEVYDMLTVGSNVTIIRQ